MMILTVLGLYTQKYLIRIETAPVGFPNMIWENSISHQEIIIDSMAIGGDGAHALFSRVRVYANIYADRSTLYVAFRKTVPGTDSPPTRTEYNSYIEETGDTRTRTVQVLLCHGPLEVG